MSATVSVVVLTWNGRALLDVALGSLEHQSLVPLEVIVVDNGSTDGTPEHLDERWPQVQMVALPTNVGFAAGVNRGLERARGEFIALINNDIELHPEYLRELAAGLEHDPSAASAASKMLRFDDHSVIDATGDTLRWSGIALQRGQGELDAGQYDRPERVFSACAGAALYRRSAFEELGMFDEDFFVYLEDVDWGFRAQLAGHGCAYVPTAIAYHVGSATTRPGGKPNPFFYALPRRNSVWMVLKNYPASALLRYAPLLLVNHTALAYVAIRDGMARAHWTALRDAVRGLPRVLRQRRTIQAARRIGRRELDPLITRGWPPR